MTSQKNNNEELNLDDLKKNVSKNEITISDLDKIITIWIQTLERLFPNKIPFKKKMFLDISKKLKNKDKEKWKESKISKKVGLCLKFLKKSEKEYDNWILNLEKEEEIGEKYMLYDLDHLSKYMGKTMLNLDFKYQNEVIYISGSAENRCYVILNDGTLMCQGENGFYQLGLGYTSKYINEFVNLTKADLNSEKKINLPIQIKKITTGFSHTLILNKDGEVYGVGCSQNGRLGLRIENEEDLKVWSKLPINNVKDIQAGSVTSLFLKRDGTVYSCGKRCYNGIGKKDIYIPSKLEIGDPNKKIVQIGNGHGSYHSGALNEEGEYFTWGHNRVGQLGISDLDVRRYIKRENYTVNYDSDDSAEVKEEDILNNSELLTRIIKPILVKFDQSIVKFSLGWGHSVVLTKNKKLYICGRNNELQCGVIKKNCKTKESLKEDYINRIFLDSFTLIQKFEKVDDFSVSFNINIVKADGKLFMTGEEEPWVEININGAKLWSAIDYDNICLKNDIGPKVLLKIC
jgi:hypothetical protein